MFKIKGETVRQFIRSFLISLTVMVLLFWAYRFEGESDFVILFDKVGDPVVLATFRVDPVKYDKEKEDPNHCDVGGDKLYTPWNVSVFTAANEGDVLRRYHYASYYQIFGKAFWANCYERFAPVKIVSLWPDMGKWPFREGDISEKDPDYARIYELTKSQR